MKSIGIDITSSGIAVVELNSDRSSFSVIKGHFFPLNINDLENWEIDLLQILKEVRNIYDLENNVVATGINQSSISNRNVTFPFSRRLDILKSLPFELDEELPMGSDHAIFDAKMVSSGANESSVLAYVSPKEQIEKLLEVFNKVQVDPDIISAESAAFANLIENWNQGSFLLSPPEAAPAPLTMRLFFRHDSTLVTLFRDNQLISTRSVAWGERQLINEITRNYNYPYEQAEQLIPAHTKLLLSLAGASAEAIKMSSVIEKSLRPFLYELKMMFIDIEDRFQTTVENIILSGRISGIENINALITKTFAIPTNTAKIDGDILNVYQVDAVAPFVDRVAIAIGYAIEGFKRPKNPAINFRQDEFAKRNQFLEKTWNKWGHAILLASIAYVALIAYGFMRESIATSLEESAFEQLQKTAGTVANLRGAQATPERIQNYLDEEAEKVQNLKIFEKVQDIDPAMKVVANISAELPSSKTNSYDIHKIDVKFSTITIEGEAKQKSTVDLLRKKLEAFSSDKKVQTVTPSIGKTNGVTFAFRFRVKG
ncbi:MAG: pilus assembly protein PilM [Bdellovibrionaceae bacterium]|nr:pilus assembly protein PilM [Pseudobdellovibrionaceae bacterium]